MSTDVLHTDEIMQGDPVAAIATPPGVSGIAVIRVSGKDAVSLCGHSFSGADLAQQASHTAHVGMLLNAEEERIDQVVATVFRSPHSYTGEDTVEISCHGGSVVANLVLERLFELGIRQAEPGEFTRRAFLNGKMDLSQAEAVADLIHAQSSDAHRASLAQLDGKLSGYVAVLRDALIHAASLLELTLDFAEEEVELLDMQQLTQELHSVHAKIDAAIETYRSGKIIREGVRTVIAGKPNAGKSSLLNALLQFNRAIVTEIPGTTRDYIEEMAVVSGELFRFIDTAGLRTTGDTVEQLGIAAGRELFQTADITVCLVDGALEDRALTDIEAARTGFLEAGVQEESMLLAVNKVDLLGTVPQQHAERHRADVYISAKTGEGLEALKHALVERVRQLKNSQHSGEVLITNIRHVECLRQSRSFIEKAMQAVESRRSEEIIAFEIRQAISALGEIIGEVVTDDILNTIFSRFCIGK